MRYGLIGLGNLGAALAGSLARGGFAPLVHDRDPARRAELEAAGARWAESPAALAAEVDAVITCLPSPAASAAVLDAVLPGARSGMDWIEMSTLGRAELMALAGRAEAAGMGVLEAPVTGGVHLAARGEITVLLGGDPALIARHRPAFEAMGGQVIEMGPLGAAALIKVITNMLAFIHLLSCGEALMLAQARRAGPGQGVGGDRGLVGHQLRARDRGAADPQRQL
jgi:3-hydroxyisobutyrate dehydrogenase